jgi:hypothetical protein
MGFWGFCRLDQDTPDREHVANRRLRHEIDPQTEVTGGHDIPAFPEEGVRFRAPTLRVSDLTHKSRSRGIVEFLPPFLRIRPYRREECDDRFFRRCSTPAQGPVAKDN